MKSMQYPLAGLALAMLAATGLAPSANAQSGNRANDLLDEITVTARKREENLRDVPVAVTAMTAQEIQRANITDVQSLAMATPGFSYRLGFGRSTGNASNRPSIRGMSSILGNPNASFFIDGVYVDGPINSYSLENLERVEVIRGPQAATFGRGTFAGAVNFVTRRPGDESDGRLRLDIGTHDLSELNGYVAGPIVEGKLAYELSGRYYNRGADPDYVNIAPNPAPLGAEETKNIGVKLNWTPTDTVSVYTTLNWSADEDGSFAYGLWNGGDNAGSNINTNSPNTSNCFGPTFNPFVPIFTVNRSRGYYCGEIGTPTTFWSETGGLPGITRDTFSASILADFDIGEYTLSSVTGYSKYDWSNAFGTVHDGQFTSSVAWEDVNGNRTVSQELRLLSPQDRRVRWGVGAYYFRRKNGSGFSTSFFPNNGQGPEDADITGGTFDDNSEVENQAVFASLDFDLTDALTVSAEVRYQEEDVKLSATTSSGTERFDGAPSQSFTATLPRVAVSWALSDYLNLYGSIAQGNNPGDFNSAYHDTRFVQAERDLFVASRGSYDESDVTSYEIGMKGVFLDGRISLNAALYLNEWEKQALSNSDALTQVATGTQTTITYITNAGESEIKGIEIELTAIPTDWLDLRLNYALAQSEFKDYIDENWRDLQDTNGIYTGLDFMGNMIVDTVDPDGQVAGNELPQTPEHMANLGATLHWPVGAAGNEFFVRADYNYESKRYVQAANLAWVGDSSVVNARIGYGGENWEVSLWGTNITNDDTPEVVTRLIDFRQFFLIPSQVRVSGLRGTFIRDFAVTAPRTAEYGINFTLDF